MQLKQNISGLTLSKSSGTPGAPFPIRAAAEVSAVPEAERYDVSGFLLTVQLQQGVLGPAEPNDNVNSTGLLDAVSVEVSSPELPTKLRRAVAAELKRLWAASAPGRAGVLVWLPDVRHAWPFLRQCFTAAFIDCPSPLKLH